MILDLLRHGETTSQGVLRGRLDDELTADGRQSMLSTIASSVQQPPQWQAIVSSPRQRCAEPARYWAQQLQLPVYFEPQLQELDFGRWEGLSIPHIHATEPELLGKFWTEPTRYGAPEGESFLNFEQRIVQACSSLFQQYHDQRILLVTHGGVIKLLKSKAQQLPLDQVLSMPAALATLHSVKVTKVDNQLHFSMLDNEGFSL